MNIPPLNNPYALLALFLSPWKDQETIDNLSYQIRNHITDWGPLVYMANLHFCGPLWFSRLRRDDLLHLLPMDLQTFLMHVHQANRERQAAFQRAAMEITETLHKIQAPVILLKGAATLWDDLYQDDGARMMGDLDLLIKPDHIELLRRSLLRFGYFQEENCFKNPGFMNSNAGHHLPRFVKPGSPVAVEVHFEIGQAQAGRILPAAMGWAHKQATTREGLTAYILTPTYRLLHHAAHALVPDAAYVTSIVPLNQLAEFAYLTHRYSSDINWREWLARGACQGLNRQFRLYLTFAHSLMGMPLPNQIRPIAFSNLHVARISAAGNAAAGYESEICLRGAVPRIKARALRMYIRLFRKFNRPAWVWRNLFYTQDPSALPFRIYGFLTFFLRRIRFPFIG